MFNDTVSKNQIEDRKEEKVEERREKKSDFVGLGL